MTWPDLISKYLPLVLNLLLCVVVGPLGLFLGMWLVSTRWLADDLTYVEFLKIKIPALGTTPRNKKILRLFGAGIIFITVIGVGWIVYNAIIKYPVATLPSASLIGANYIVDEWNPRLIDLRTAGQDGIPAFPNHSLRLFDLYVFVPEESSGYVIQAEVSVNDELIGATQIQKTTSGVMKLGAVAIRKYPSPIISTAWNVGENWTELEIKTRLFNSANDTKSVAETLISIKINPSGTSWMISPPYATLYSLSYTLNDGPNQTIDARQALSQGLTARKEDKMCLTGVNYNGDFRADKGSVGIVADFMDTHKIVVPANGYNPEPFKPGINDILGFQPYCLNMPEANANLYLSLTNNGTIVDLLSIKVTIQP